MKNEFLLMPPVIVFLKLILLTSSKDNNLPFKAFILPFKAFFSTSMVKQQIEHIQLIKENESLKRKIKEINEILDELPDLNNYLNS